jgi:peroxiredoxin (alkyl hydroperoxide reductase subunit C)
MCQPSEKAAGPSTISASDASQTVSPVTATPMGSGGGPRLNEPAPAFHATTTHGTKQLSDYRGRWLVLFSHPADFTPVCTTEFIAFAKAHPTFQAIECDLLGLSIDSVFSHIAWMRNIKEKFDVEIPFPIIEDLSMQVAHAYGMVQPGASDTSAVRAVFVIDPQGILRAMLYYPMSNGRSVNELLRLVQALQTSDQHKVATPEGWTPGAPVIVPPPKTLSEANERARSKTGDCVDWYFCRRTLDVAVESAKGS